MASRKQGGLSARDRGSKAKPHGNDVSAISSRSKTANPPDTPNATPGKRVAEPGPSNLESIAPETKRRS